MVAIVIAGLASCSADTAPYGDQRTLPADVRALASSVRDGGGVVVRGAVTSRHAAPPARILAAQGVYVEYEQVDATLRVDDALGDAAPPSMTLRGSTGVAHHSDAAGARLPDDALSPPSSVATSQRLTADATGVFFLYPRATATDGAPGWTMYWHAPLVDAVTVSGEGTQSGAGAPLSSLRR